MGTKVSSNGFDSTFYFNEVHIIKLHCRLLVSWLLISSEKRCHLEYESMVNRSTIGKRPGLRQRLIVAIHPGPSVDHIRYTVSFWVEL